MDIIRFNGALRRAKAWTLLVVFVPMLLLASLHCHEGSAGGGGVCVQCATHQPHSGHLSPAAGCLHDCVLCQFGALPYLFAAAVVLPLLPRACRAAYACMAPAHCAGLHGATRGRSPPFIQHISI